MIVITKTGYYSTVADVENPNLVHVRTWIKADAQHFLAYYQAWLNGKRPQSPAKAKAPKAELVTIDPADFPWRVTAPRTVWMEFCFDAAMEVDYPRWKPAVEDHARAGVYLDMWLKATRLEGLDPEKRREGGYDAAWAEKVRTWGTEDWSLGQETDDDWSWDEGRDYRSGEDMLAADDEATL